jgi:hypothetical protein
MYKEEYLIGSGKKGFFLQFIEKMNICPELEIYLQRFDMTDIRDGTTFDKQLTVFLSNNDIKGIEKMLTSFGITIPGLTDPVTLATRDAHIEFMRQLVDFLKKYIKEKEQEDEAEEEASAKEVCGFSQEAEGKESQEKSAEKEPENVEVPEENLREIEDQDGKNAVYLLTELLESGFDLSILSEKSQERILPLLSLMVDNELSKKSLSKIEKLQGNDRKGFCEQMLDTLETIKAESVIKAKRVFKGVAFAEDLEEKYARFIEIMLGDSGLSDLKGLSKQLSGMPARSRRNKYEEYVGMIMASLSGKTFVPQEAAIGKNPFDLYCEFLRTGMKLASFSAEEQELILAFVNSMQEEEMTLEELQQEAETEEKPKLEDMDGLVEGIRFLERTAKTMIEVCLDGEPVPGEELKPLLGLIDLLLKTSRLPNFQTLCRTAEKMEDEKVRDIFVTGIMEKLEEKQESEAKNEKRTEEPSEPMIMTILKEMVKKVESGEMSAEDVLAATEEDLLSMFKDKDSKDFETLELLGKTVSIFLGPLASRLGPGIGTIPLAIMKAKNKLEGSEPYVEELKKTAANEARKARIFFDAFGKEAPEGQGFTEAQAREFTKAELLKPSSIIKH